MVAKVVAELERRVAERTAERNRIWEMSHDLFAIMGFDGYLKAINPAWEATLGFDEATLLAMDFPKQVHPDDHEQVGAADRFLVAAVGAAVGERAERDVADLDPDLLRDPLRELRMRAAGEEHEPLRRPGLDPVLRLDLRLGLRDLEPRQAGQLSRRAFHGDSPLS